MVGGILEIGTFLLSLASKVAKSEHAEDLESASKTLGVFKSINKQLSPGSVQNSAGRAVIAPLVLFEDTLTHQEYMADLMTIINLRDIRDVLSHLELEGSVGDVKIANIIDQINPNRRAGFNALLGCEALNPEPNEYLEKALKDRDARQNKKEDGSDKSDKGNDSNSSKNKVTIDSKDMGNLEEYAPLALGRTVKASLNIDGKEANFHLTFRQIPIAAPAKNIELMFQAARKGENWAGRVKEYRAGGISKPEFMRGTDLIKQEFKIRNNDLTGYYQETAKRSYGNNVKAVTTGFMSMNTMANTIIITKETADNIELELGMRFNSTKIAAIRKYLSANTIVIVNDARGIFEFYTVGVPIPVKYTLQHIKVKAKKEDTGSLESLIKLLSGR